MSGIGAYLIVLRVRGSAPEWGAGVSDVAAGDAVAAVAVELCDEQLAAVLRRGAAGLRVLVFVASARAHQKTPGILSTYQTSLGESLSCPSYFPE